MPDEGKQTDDFWTKNQNIYFLENVRKALMIDDKHIYRKNCFCLIMNGFLSEINARK